MPPDHPRTERCARERVRTSHALPIGGAPDRWTYKLFKWFTRPPSDMLNLDKGDVMDVVQSLLEMGAAVTMKEKGMQEMVIMVVQGESPGGAMVVQGGSPEKAMVVQGGSPGGAGRRAARGLRGPVWGGWIQRPEFSDTLNSNSD